MLNLSNSLSIANSINFACENLLFLLRYLAKEGEIMRYIITMIWSCIFCEIIGFIAASLTQMQFNPMQSLIIGAVFGLLFAIIIPAITAKSYKDKSKYNKL